MSSATTPSVTILLSTHNGAEFLPAQLASFAAQTYPTWSLLWRDDASTDATVAVMTEFITTGRGARLAAPQGRLGVLGSFLALLRAATPALGARDAVAFADQDDVWLAEKLARGMAALATVADGVPALVCTRQILTDAGLHPIGLSPPLRHPPGFPASLVQNIATGCTILLNRAAARLIADSIAPPSTWHDWWAYLVVSAAGGRILCDAQPQVLYRQHGANAVGAPASQGRRAWNAARRGSAAFMRLLRDHLAALAAQPQLLNPTARQQVLDLQAAVASGIFRRARALATPGLRRQRLLETFIFRLWFLLG